MKFGVKAKLVSLMLGFVMLFSCVLATAVQVKAHADREDYDIPTEGYDVDAINAELDAAEIDEDSIIVEDDYIEETYQECLYFEEDPEVEPEKQHLGFNLEGTEIYEIYGERILDFSMTYETFVEEVEGLHEAGTWEASEDDWAEICKLREVQRNIQGMNECIDEGLGYIDETGELIIYEEVNIAARLRAWSFKWKWNKVSFSIDAELSILYSLFCLYIRFSAEIKTLDMFLHLINGSPNSARNWVFRSLEYLPDSLAASVKTSFTDEFFMYILSLFPLFEQLRTATNILEVLVKAALWNFCASTKDSAILLFNAVVYSSSARITSCWFGTSKQRGTAVKIL